MQTINVVFFGSTTDSLLVLEKLYNLQSTTCNLQLSAVVTQPPRAVGRKQVMTPTPVESWAKAKHIPILSFPSDKQKPWLYDNEQTVIDALQPFHADMIISACYGQKIPTQTIADAKYQGLNVHPSLLPRWRGADPVPWAIVAGDHQTGVTVVTLSEQFDEGRIIAQKKIAITDKDFSEPLRTKLFTLGADLLIEHLEPYLSQQSMKEDVQTQITRRVKDIRTRKVADVSYAHRLTRQDGFEPWETLQKAINEGVDADRIERKFRAFHPWPGVWTMVNVTNPTNTTNPTNEKRRLKILACHVDQGKLVLEEVQLEGKNSVSFIQFQSAYQYH